MRRSLGRRNRILPVILIVVLATALAPATALARRPLWFSPPVVQQNAVIYDSTVTPLPQHLPSLAFYSQHVMDIGDEVTFAGSSRALQQVTVTLVSWACQTGYYKNLDCATTPGATFPVTGTFTIYNVGQDDNVGSVIATTTQTFNIPFQPSYDAEHCSTNQYGGFYDADSDSCYNGIDTNVSFDFSSMAVTLPDSVIYGISFNTSSYGADPYGTDTLCFNSEARCPYDLLNLGFGPEVVVGSKPHPDTIFLNTTTKAAYCDSGDAGLGTFRLDSPTNACWTDLVPAVQFTAGTPPATGNLAWLYNFVRQFYSFHGR